MAKSSLTLGPLLFNWKPEAWRDFYYRMADESCVDTVYIGEVVCAKRIPLFEPYFAGVLERLRSAGKQVVLSTLAEVMIKRERKLTELSCGFDDLVVEANDTSALYHLRGRRHRVGPYVNAYNEDTLAFLAGKGAVHVSLPPELPRERLAVLAEKGRELGVSLEVSVFGRMPLALSARCYHARAHGRVKDNCQFVCEQDPDGMLLHTLDEQPFLAINGIQTLSHTCLNLLHHLSEMQDMGLAAFRLSPHSSDMVETARLFRRVLDREFEPAQASERLAEIGPDQWGAGGGPAFSNGFYHGCEGFRWVEPPQVV